MHDKSQPNIYNLGAMHIEDRAKLITSLFFEVGKCNVLPQQKAVQIKNPISG